MKDFKEIRTVEYYLQLNYPITLYRAEEGGYVVEIEDLPGCITEGETLEEVTQRIDDAREGWIRAAYEDEFEIPLPRNEEEYSGKFMTRIPKYLHRRLVERARREGVSLNQYIHSILSASVATKDIIEEMRTSFDKMLSKIQIYQKPVGNYFIIPPLDVRWMIGDIEEESTAPKHIGVRDREQVAA